MLFIEEAFFSGCISKVINDGKDYSWVKIKSVINDRHDQNISTKIYHMIERALNIVTDKKFKDTDKLYDAIEKIFSEFENNGDTLESVKCGLNVLGTDVSAQRCKNFLEKFYQGIRQDDDLCKEVIMDLEQKGIKINQEEFQKINKKLDKNHMELVEKLGNISENLNESSLISEENTNHKKLMFVNNKKQDYIKIWNSKMFLHIGENKKIMTLSDAFVMPDYEIHKAISQVNYFYFDTLDVIIKKFTEHEKTSTMLITGVPGIGKSSITSWIANEYKDDDRFIILRFRDWDSEELEKGLLRTICKTLGCKNKDLKYKILILDGFDEMKLLDIRDRLLNAFFNDIKDGNNFKCIITSRPTYIDSSHFQNVIELKEFNIDKVDVFYRNIKGKGLTGRERIEPNLEVLGIPVILYMAIMSGIDINEHYTKPELYNKIFAEKGGIFDRFYDGENEYSEGSQIMRNSENIKKYLKFLRKVAFMMFENNCLNIKIKDCEVPELEFQGYAVSILEFPIKHLFENAETDIEFIHKSIYEYFVSEYIFSSLLTAINMEKEKIASILGELLKSNDLSLEILEFLKFKIRNSKLNNEFDKAFQTFKLMLQDGMTYYTGVCYKNVIKCEMNVFSNMLEILHLWEDCSLEFDYLINDYLKYNRKIGLNLKGTKFIGSLKGAILEEAELIEADLEKAKLIGVNARRVNLKKANLKEADLGVADLTGANLQETNLIEANLRETILIKADLTQSKLIKADLREVNLQKTNLEKAYLQGAKFDINQVDYLDNKYDLKNIKVYTGYMGELLDYKEYCKRYK